MTPSWITDEDVRAMLAGPVSSDALAEIEHEVATAAYGLGRRDALAEAAERLRNLQPWERPTSGVLSPQEAAKYIDALTTG